MRRSFRSPALMVFIRPTPRCIPTPGLGYRAATSGVAWDERSRPRRMGSGFEARGLRLCGLVFSVMAGLTSIPLQRGRPVQPLN